MAWICVNNEVLEEKASRLSNHIECSKNEAIGILVSLYIRLQDHVDDDGKLAGLNADDIGQELVSVSKRRIDQESLIDCGAIDEKDGDIYIKSHSTIFGQWSRMAKKREKDAHRKRLERQAVKNGDKPESTKKADLELPSLPESPSTKKEAKDDYESHFVSFWDEYPRKIGKGDAYKCYKARLKDGWSPEELKAAASNYKAKVLADRTEQKYIKHPKTFLSATTPFVDYLPKETEATRNQEVNENENPYEEWNHGR